MGILTEAKRKRVKPRQVSGERLYQEDYKNYDKRIDVKEEVKKVTEHFKNREDAILKSEYKMHILEGDFSSFNSLHLFPGKDGKDDIVIVFKMHRDDHVVFHGIGNHEQAYDRNRLKRNP